MSGLAGMSDYFILKHLILRGNVSAFSATRLKKAALRFERSSRKSFWRGLRERPRALINALRPLPTCFAHVERIGNIVSLRGKNSRRKCATRSTCAAEIHEIVRFFFTCLFESRYVFHGDMSMGWIYAGWRFTGSTAHFHRGRG